MTTNFGDPTNGQYNTITTGNGISINTTASTPLITTTGTSVYGQYSFPYNTYTGPSLLLWPKEYDGKFDVLDMLLVPDNNTAVPVETVLAKCKIARFIKMSSGSVIVKKEVKELIYLYLDSESAMPLNEFIDAALSKDGEEVTPQEDDSDLYPIAPVPY